ncbi:MAG: formylglycine-generating enzyme family protein [Xanthobacteraceae bacterium]
MRVAAHACACIVVFLSSPLLAEQQVFKDCDTCPEMVVLPAGSFMMGSPPDDKDARGNEEPQHLVTIPRPFAAGRFAVTFEEWDACVAGGGCNGYAPSDSGWGRGRKPVINVSWYDVQGYVAWLSRKTGKAYRLLSEAEREYAARAGTKMPFWWGSSISASQANFSGGYSGGVLSGGSKGPVAVDSFQPNPWGLYQVHGNVWELVEDCYHASYAGAPSDASAWTSGDCSFRVARGGSWAKDASFLRAASRSPVELNRRDSGVGFRLGRMP